MIKIEEDCDHGSIMYSSYGYVVDVHRSGACQVDAIQTRQPRIEIRGKSLYGSKRLC
jgi:hypothetical protein